MTIDYRWYHTYVIPESSCNLVIIPLCLVNSDETLHEPGTQHCFGLGGPWRCDKARSWTPSTLRSGRLVCTSNPYSGWSSIQTAWSLEKNHLKIIPLQNHFKNILALLPCVEAKLHWISAFQMWQQVHKISGTSWGVVSGSFDKTIPKSEHLQLNANCFQAAST